MRLEGKRITDFDLIIWRERERERERERDAGRRVMGRREVVYDSNASKQK